MGAGTGAPLCARTVDSFGAIGPSVELVAGEGGGSAPEGLGIAPDGVGGGIAPPGGIIPGRPFKGTVPGGMPGGMFAPGDRFKASISAAGIGGTMKLEDT